MRFSALNAKLIIPALALIAGFAVAKSGDFIANNSSGLMADLQKGNSRFIEGKNSFPRVGPTRRSQTAKGQTPFATVLACADSRVAPEFIFDQGIGDLFTIRVAGNVADTDEIGTIEYGVGHLKTPLLIVLGHSQCGAVKAVVQNAQVSQNIRCLVDNIVPAAQRAKAHHEHGTEAEIVEATVEENVAQAIQDILQRSKEVREKVAEGHLAIFGGVYNIETGKVRWLGQKPDAFKAGG